MLVLQTVVGVLSENPELAIVLGLALRAVRAWQTELTWYEYRTLHGVKRLVLPALNSPALSTVSRKGNRGDPAFLTTYKGTVRATVTQLREGGGSLHLINTIKVRPGANGDPVSRAHLVWTHADGRQTEAFLFKNDDGTTDVYVHVETSVSDPTGHLTDTVDAGDGRKVVSDALGLTTTEPDQAS